MANRRLVSAIITGSSLVLCAAAVRGAPPAPEFGFHKVPFTKVSEGEIRAPGGRGFVVDGPNIYAPVIGRQFDRFAANQVTSTDGGVTWGAARPMGRPLPHPADPYSFRMALSPDPASSGQKLLHATWLAEDGVTLNYTYSHAGVGDWSVLITTTVAGSSGTIDSLAADSNGGVHFIRSDFDSVFYTETTAPGAPFSAPVVIATNVINTVFYLSSLEIDASNTLYLVVPNQPELVLLKRTSGSSTWESFPITADHGNALYQSPTLLVSDPHHLAVAYGFVPVVGGLISSPTELRFAYSNDGGVTWNRRSVETDVPSTFHSSALAMSTEYGHPVMTLASSDNKGLSIFRSDDGFKTWNRTSTNIGDNIPYIGVDGKGRTLLMVGGFDPSDALFPASAVYFLREFHHE